MEHIVFLLLFVNLMDLVKVFLGFPKVFKRGI